MGYSVTSLQTKKIIASSLKKAMRTKPLSKITVSEIVKDCGLNRKTFYYHFEDIYDLLKWMFDLMEDYEKAIVFVMDYVEKNQYIINCAYDSMGRDGMKHFFYADFIELVTSIVEGAEKKAQLTLKPDFKKFICAFYTEALAGTLVDWVKAKDRRSRQETITYISSIFKSSITAILATSQQTLSF